MSGFAPGNISADSGRVAARVAVIARRQHGVVSRAQLLEAGMKPATISRWERAGHLHRLHRGVYAVGHPGIDLRGEWLAAVLACGPGAALSHTSAARHLGIAERRAEAIHVSIPRARNCSPRGIVVHRPRSLEAIDVHVRFSIAATTAARTLFDEAAQVSARMLRDHFYAAESLRILNRPRLAALLSGSRGQRGLGTLRELLAEGTLPLDEVRSLLEQAILAVCAEFSLPVPVPNAPVLDYTVDFLWPQARFIVEADGGHHRGPQRDRDNERDLRLSRAGYLVRRYSSRAIADRRRLVSEISDVLAERFPGFTGGALAPAA